MILGTILHILQCLSNFLPYYTNTGKYIKKQKDEEYDA